MPVWPKSFYTFRASLLTRRMARRLRRNGGAISEQERIYADLVRQLARTTFWRDAGVDTGIPYEKFRTRVAPRTHAQLLPAIERMQRGKPDVLWPGTCALFAETAGTSAGQPRLLPVTDALLAHFRKAGLYSILHYTARADHARVFRGRHLLLGESTGLRRSASLSATASVGDVSDIALLNLPAWVQRHLVDSDAAVAGIRDWEPRLDAAAARALTQDISLVAGLPNWMQDFAEAVRRQASATGRSGANLRSFWPNLECFVHTGLPVSPYQEELRAVLGPGVAFHEVYAAAEGFVAAQDREPAAGLRLLGDAGVFFEFVPAGEFDEDNPALAAMKAVPLSGVKTGVDYALLLTTPGGLARYVLGDVVRFVSTSPPRLVPVGRTRLQLNAFGERVTEKHLTDTLVSICRRQGWTLVNFHVAPLFASSLVGQQHGRHEWWLELKPGTVATPTGPQIAPQLDAELLRINEEYAARRRNNTLEMPVVRLVMPGVFAHWQRFHGAQGGLHKSPRCRSDRLVADELAQITNFARD